MIWSPFELVHGEYEQILSHPVRVDRSGPITVYLRAWKKWDDKHGDVYWDDARLIEVGGDGVCPTMTPYPTQTPYPTATPYPTPTPYPTYTPYPTPTGCSGECDENAIAQAVVSALREWFVGLVWRVD